MLGASEDESFVEKRDEAVGSDSGRSCLVDKMELCFPVVLSEPVWNCDVRDEGVEQPM